jgi:hypothetical protein
MSLISVSISNKIKLRCKKLNFLGNRLSIESSLFLSCSSEDELLKKGGVVSWAAARGLRGRLGRPIRVRIRVKSFLRGQGSPSI